MPAEKFISKMNERDLAGALEQSVRSMPAASRALFAEAIFHAFRARGESSEDAAEGCGADLLAISSGDESALRTLIRYAQTNAGLLKEAAVMLVDQNPEIVSDLVPALADGITGRALSDE